MNILITSVGTRDKIVQYFKKTIGNNGNVVTTDMSELAPALYEVDKHYVVPAITDSNYMNCIYDICKKEKIDAILSLIDPELSLLAKNEEEFSKLGVKVIGSSYDVCELAFNKMHMYEWLKANGYKYARSYDNIDRFYEDLKAGLISFPVFVKPICGSASIGIEKVEDEEVLNFIWGHADNLMIQEYLNGTEIGVDVYIDMISHEVVSMFAKKKLLMRAGETYKAVSIKEQRLFELVEQFCKDCGFLGQIDIDIFEINGEYYISEVNPRFGGGYPHAYECGCNHMALIENNIQNIANKKNIGNYKEGVYMMKYNETIIK